jgi:hypothetical protein
MTNYERATELADVKDRMEALLARAIEPVEGSSEQDYAEAYWIPHIRGCLNDRHSSVQSSIDSLLEDDDEENAA